MESWGNKFFGGKLLFGVKLIGIFAGQCGILKILDYCLELKLLVSEYIFFAVIAGFADAFCLLSYPSVKEWWKDIRRDIFEGLTCLVGAFCTFGERIFIYPLTKAISMRAVALFMLAGCFYIPIVKAMFALFEKKWFGGKDTRVKRKVIIDYLILFVIGMTVISAYIIAFNPAIMFWDSYYQVAQAQHVIPYDNWHPLYTTLWIECILKISNSLTMVVLVGAAFWVAVVAGACNWILGMCKKWQWVLPGMIVFLFLPNQALASVTILKDVPYAASCIWMTLILMRCRVIDDSKHINWLYVVEAILAGTTAWLVRTNGMVIVIGFVLALFYVIGKKKAIATGIGIAVTVGVFNLGILGVIEHIEIPKGAVYLALLNDVRVVDYWEGDIDDETEQLLEHAYDIDEWDSIYELSGVTYVSNTFDLDYMANYPMQKFVKNYIVTAIKNPVLMARAILVRCLVGWDALGRIADATITGITEYRYFGDVWVNGTSLKELGFQGYGERKVNCLTRYLQEFVNITLSSPWKLIIWRTGISFFLMIAELLYVIYRKKGKNIVLFLPILMHCLALILTVAWSNYRYFWPISIIPLMIFPMCSYENVKKEK